MLTALFLCATLSTPTATRALQLCTTSYEACVAVRCDSSFNSTNVQAYVTCLNVCETRYESCLQQVRSLS